jgi:hypothetical protein
LPGARLGHFVAAQRLTEDYVWRWFLGSGHTFVRREGLDTGPSYRGVPRWAIRGYVEARVLALLLRPFRNALWLRSFTQAARLLGVIRESHARWRRPEPEPTHGALSGSFLGQPK